MLNLVVSLIAGILLGYLLRGKKRFNFERVTFWIILVLIFSLGFSIGSSDELLSSLPSVGFKAVVISILTIVFSIFFVKIARKMVKA